MDIDKLRKIIVECAYEVRLNLSPGYLESVYRKALAIELRNRGLKVVEEMPINVCYKGCPVGEFRADIVVDDQLIIELKAISSLNRNHEIQLVNYLTATGIDYGYLINYGSFDYRIMFKTREYKK